MGSSRNLINEVMLLYQFALIASQLHSICYSIVACSLAKLTFINEFKSWQTDLK